MNFRPLLSLALSALVAGCGSPKAPSAQATDDKAAPAYTLEYTDVMDFVRGVEGSFRIAGAFTSGDSPRLTIDGLPDGAQYKGDMITWTPPCELKLENGQFMRGYMVYRLRINLMGLGSDSLVQKPAIAVVHMLGEGSPCED